MNGTFPCPHCGVANPAGAQFCEACGKALPVMGGTGPRVIPDFMVASTAAGQQLQHDELRKQMKQASGALLLVAILQALLGPIMTYVALQDAQKNAPPGVVMYIPASSWFIIFGVAAIFFALWAWSRFNPFPAAIVGLVVFISVHLLSAVQDPTNLVKGIILKIVVISILVKAIQAGAKYRDLQRQGAVAG